MSFLYSCFDMPFPPRLNLSLTPHHLLQCLEENKASEIIWDQEKRKGNTREGRKGEGKEG